MAGEDLPVGTAQKADEESSGGSPPPEGTKPYYGCATTAFPALINGVGKEVRLLPSKDETTPRYMTNSAGLHIFYPDTRTKSHSRNRVYWSQTELHKLGITTLSDGTYLLKDRQDADQLYLGKEKSKAFRFSHVFTPTFIRNSARDDDDSSTTMFWISYGREQLPIEYTYAKAKPIPATRPIRTASEIEANAENQYLKYQKAGIAQNKSTNYGAGLDRPDSEAFQKVLLDMQSLCAYVRFCQDENQDTAESPTYDHPDREGKDGENSFKEMRATWAGFYDLDRALTMHFFPHQKRKLIHSPHETGKIGLLQRRDAKLYNDALRSPAFRRLNNNIALKMTMAYLGYPVEPINHFNKRSMGFDTNDEPALPLKIDSASFRRKKFPMQFLDGYGERLGARRADAKRKPGTQRYKASGATSRDTMAADDLESAKQNARHRLNDTRASARSRSSRHIRRNHQAQEQKLKPDYSNMFGSFQAAGPATTLRGGCPPPSHTWFSDLTISDFTGYGHTVGLRGGAVSEEYDEDEEVGENDDVLMLDAPQNCAGFAMTSNDNAPLSLRGGSSQTAEPNSNGDEDTTVIASLEARIVRKMKHLQDANPSLSEMEARQEAINILENVANIQSSVEYQSSVNAAAPSSPCLERTAPEDVEQTAVFYVESDYEYADEIPWTVEEEDAKIKELLDATEGTVSEAEAREAVEQHNAARRHVLNQRFPPSVGIDQTDPSFPGTGAGVENLVRTKWQTLAFNHCSPNAAQRLLIENHDYEQATLERGVYCHFCKATIYMPEIQCLEEHFRGHINRTGECAWCGMDIHKLDFEEKRDHLRSHRNWVTFKVNKIYSIATDPVSRIEKENETRNLQAALLLYCSGCGFDLRKIQNAKELIEHTKECPDGYHDSGDPRHCLYCGLELATLKNPQVHRGECRGTDAALFKDHQLNALVNANYDDSTTNCTRDEIYKALLLIVAPSDDREGELLRCRYAGCNYDLAEAVRTSRTVQPIQNHLNVHVKNKDQFRQTCPMQDCMTDLGVLSAEDKTIHMQTHMQTHMAGRAAASQPSPHQPQPVRPNPKSPEDTALSGEACHFPGCARQWLKEEMVEGQPRLVRAVVAKSHWKKHFGELKSGLYKDYVEKPGSYRHLLNEKRSKRECAFEQCQPREKSKFNDELLDGPKGQLYWRYHTQFHFDEADFMDDKHPFAKNPLDHDFSENTPKTPQRVAPVEPSAESGTNADAGASASRLDGDETPEPEGTDDRALTRYFETESPGMYEMIPQEWRNALKMLPKLEDADLLKHFDRAQVRAWKGPKTWIFFCRACTKTITGKHIWIHRSVQKNGVKHKQKSCKHDDDRQWAVTTPFLRKYYEENQNTINPRADVYLPCPAPGILWRTWGDIVQNEPAVKEHLLKAPPIKTIKHKELPRAPGTDFIGMNLGHRRNDAGMAVTDKGEVARPSTNEQSDKNDEPEESRKRKRETDESTEAPLPKKRARRKIRKRYW